MLLAEDHIAARAVQRPPAGNAAFQGASHARSDVGMPAADFLEDRHRADGGCRLQHRHDFRIPYLGEQIGTPPAARHLPL
jgi:hypothetical protein